MIGCRCAGRMLFSTPAYSETYSLIISCRLQRQSNQMGIGRSNFFLFAYLFLIPQNLVVDLAFLRRPRPR